MDETPAFENLGMIILAAGASSRMKKPKQLLKIDGQTMLRRVVETALGTVFRPTVVVLGANAATLRDEIRIDELTVVINENWQDGLSSSIKEGLRELLRIAPETAAALVVLADQPLIKAEQFNLFASRFIAADVSVVAAEYGETTGVPALFSRETFGAFEKLTGDVGAKAVISQFRENLVTISLPEAAFDVDTPEDFRRIVG